MLKSTDLYYLPVPEARNTVGGLYGSPFESPEKIFLASIRPVVPLRLWTHCSSTCLCHVTTYLGLCLHLVFLPVDDHQFQLEGPS